MPSPVRPMAHAPVPRALPRPPGDQSSPTRDTGANTQPAAVASVGGVLHFELKQAPPSAVHVVRVHRRDDGTRLYCSALFDDEREFLDWLDSDPVRFHHPLVFQQARRSFAQLLAKGEGHGAVRS